MVERAHGEIRKLFQDYAGYHRARGNIITHFVGIPMIVCSSLGMLDRIVLAPSAFWVHISPALVAWLALCVYYLRLHLWLGGSMVFTTGALYVLGARLPMAWLVLFFILGWVFQYAGHYLYEGKKPAFYKNLVHLVVGPIFIQNYALRMIKL